MLLGVACLHLLTKGLVSTKRVIRSIAVAFALAMVCNSLSQFLA